MANVQSQMLAALGFLRTQVPDAAVSFTVKTADGDEWKVAGFNTGKVGGAAALDGQYAGTDAREYYVTPGEMPFHRLQGATVEVVRADGETETLRVIDADELPAQSVWRLVCAAKERLT